MKQILSLLSLLLAIVVLSLVMVRTFHLAVLPELLDDLINYCLGYVLAHLVIDFRTWRSERRKVWA